MSGQSQPVLEAEQSSSLQQPGGIGRIVWLVGTIALTSGAFLLMQWFTTDPYYPGSQSLEVVIVPMVLGLAILASHIGLNSLRLKNLGINPWWSLGVFVPLLNLGIELGCLIGPTGFQQRKRLDALSWLMIACAGCFAAYLFYGIADGLFSMGHGRASTDPVKIMSQQVFYAVAAHFVLGSTLGGHGLLGGPLLAGAIMYQNYGARRSKLAQALPERSGEA